MTILVLQPKKQTYPVEVDASKPASFPKACVCCMGAPSSERAVPAQFQSEFHNVLSGTTTTTSWTVGGLAVGVCSDCQDHFHAEEAGREGKAFWVMAGTFIVLVVLLGIAVFLHEGLSLGAIVQLVLGAAVAAPISIFLTGVLFRLLGGVAGFFARTPISASCTAHSFDEAISVSRLHLGGGTPRLCFDFSSGEFADAFEQQNDTP